MKNTKTILLIVLSLITANAAFAQSRIGGKVIEIIDGKTAIVEMQNGSRLTAELQYIEVPESGQPFSEIAKQHLGALVLNQIIEFRARGFRPTVTVGQIFCKGVDISQQMIRDGAAWYAVPQKSGQDAAERENYQSQEAQAKSEKLGIWSIENLKPSWQIRAEAEENQRQQEKIARKAAEDAALVAEIQQQQQKPPVKRQMSSEMQMLAMSADAAVKMPANMKMVGGLMVGYEPSIKLGVVATPLMKMDVEDVNGKQAVSIQIAYLYFDGDENKGRQSVYLVGVDSESKEFKFLKYNELVVTADNQKIVIGKAKRVARQNDYGVKEGLLYEIKKNVFTKIANAQNLDVKVGTYSRKLDGAVQLLLKNLLQSSL